MISFFLIVCVLLALVLSVVFVIVMARRFGLPAIPVILLFTIGFAASVALSNLVFSLLVGESGFLLTDNRSILGGGFAWAAVAFAILFLLKKPVERTGGPETTTDDFETPRHGAAWVIWLFIGYGLTSVGVASVCATLADLFVFFVYGFVSLLPVPNYLILIASIVYVAVCTIAAYLVFQLLLKRKAQTIKKILYTDATILPSQTGQGTNDPGNSSNKKLWLSGCLGFIIFICLLLGVLAGYLFYAGGQPDILDGEVSLPAKVKKGDNFDFVITRTNSTTEPVFIKHIVLSDSLGAPTILMGAAIVNVEPDMDVEAKYTNFFQYSYFKEIRPGETQVVIFHMRAENSGVYYEDVGVYARDPMHSDPAFLSAFQSIGNKMEITP